MQEPVVSTFCTSGVFLSMHKSEFFLSHIYCIAYTTNETSTYVSVRGALAIVVGEFSRVRFTQINRDDDLLLFGVLFCR